jgi:hypothetical protein
MASITREVALDVAAGKVWAAMRMVGDAHKLFDPVLVDASVDGDTRTVRFANGMVVRERILDIDDERCRVAYAALDVPGMTYHHASMQVVETASDRSTFIWITDVLPDEIGSAIEPLIDEGSRAIKQNVEQADARLARS